MAEFEQLTGWVPPEERSYSVAKSHAEFVALARVFSDAGASIAGSGEGKVVLLHKVLEKVLGHFPIHTQEIGSCVSHGWGLCIDVLKAVEIHLRGEAEEFKAETATEWIYGTSRVLVGGGRLGNQDGSLGSWAAKAVKEHGTLARLKYDAVDLTTLDERRAKDWGYRGLPYDLETIADEHPVKTSAMVASYDEARDAIANGYPVPVCSMQGFESKRDSEGFARAKGQWAHCQLPQTIIAGMEFKESQQVRAGDFVYGSDGELHQVLQRHERLYDGDVVSIRTIGSPDVTVTDEHPMLVWRSSQSEGFQFRKELDDRGGVATRVGRFVQACDVREGDYLLCPKLKFGDKPLVPEWIKTPKSKDIPAIVPDKDLAWLLGLYIADGNSVKDHRVCFTLGNSKDWQRAVDIIDRWGFESSVMEKENYRRIYVYSSTLARSLRGWFGKTSLTKRIPAWLMTWDLHSLVDGICHGDGCKPRKNEWRINTSSEVLMNQLFLILNSLGFATTVRIPKHSGGEWKRTAGAWEINYRPRTHRARTKMIDGLIAMPVQSVEITNYSGSVYNYEIEDEHSYIANGSLSHNCMAFISVDDESNRPGLLCMNSWGANWISGPKRHEQPDGSFWVEAATADKMLRERDSYAISNFQGYEKRIDELDFSNWDF